MLNLVTGPKLCDYIGNKVQENSGRQIRREIKEGQLGEKVGENLGEKVGEKTGEKVGESVGEIHKLNLGPWWEVNILSKFQFPISYGFGVKAF